MNRGSNLLVDKLNRLARARFRLTEMLKCLTLKI